MLEYRNVAFALLAAVLLQLAAGALWIALPLAMNEAGWSGLAVGSVYAAFSVGFLGGAYLAPAFIERVGHWRAFAVCAAGAACATLALALGADLTGWLVLRLIFGACLAGLFAVTESWIADATPVRHHAAVLGVYQIVGRLGLIAGPFVIASPQLSSGGAIILAGMALIVGLIPIAMTDRGQPKRPTLQTVSPARLFEIAPTSVCAVFVAGLVNSALLAFLPLWAGGLSERFATQAAACVVGAAYLGALLGQWPAGLISDRMDRRLVIAALAALAGLVALVLAVIPTLGLWAGALLAALWGAASLSWYAVAVAHAVDRSRVEELPALASGLLMIWVGGAIMGPILGGMAYSGPLQARGVFLLAATACAVLIAILVVRRRQRGPVDRSEQHPFVYLDTSSALLAEGGNRASGAGPNRDGEEEGL